MIYYSKSEEDTYNFAKTLADRVKEGDIFLIEGELGTGKSVFVRGLARALGVSEAMPSPTFTIVNEYKAKHLIYHFDFYRINDPFELYEIGFEDYIYSKGISFVEWPSKCGDLLPKNAIKININFKGDGREIIIEWTK